MAAGLVAVLACILPSQAQTVITDPPVQADGGGSYRIDSSIDNGGSDAWIGGYYAGNTLVIYATGALSNVAFGYVGGASGANHNTVTVNGGSGSVTSDLGIGTYGDYNSLTIRNVGTVSSAYGYIGGADQTHTGGTFTGSDNSGGINNSVLVTGAGSTWNVTQDLNVGWSYASTNNNLTVDSGGAVTVGGYLNIGHYGSANRLTVSNGGQMSSTLGGIIGNVDFLGAVNDNSALVTGSGSVWNAGSALFIGNCSGSGNNLTLASGGQVNNGDGVVGIDVFNFASNSNWVHVTGSGSVWSNSGDLVVGYYGVGNNLVVDSGGQVVNGISSYGAVIGLDDNAGVANNNTVLVTGSGSLWNNGSDLYVGYYSSSNNLTLASGGVGINVNGYIGYDGSLAGGQSNSVVVTGAGSTWSNTGAVNLGFQNGASSNSLLVAAAGRVFSAGGNLGGDSAAANNQVWITGTGSLWNNSSDLLVGSNGSFNSLVVDGGGQVLNNNAFIGWGSTAGSNAVRITGSGSVWTNNGDVVVGDYGAYNSLTVDSGGQVLDNNGVLGFDAGSGNNSVLVSGSGSLWSSSNSLYVGYAGANNSLTLISGGTVSATNIVVGASDTSTGNLLDVSGGRLYATNSDGGGVLNILYGTLDLNSGTVAVDRLLLTNFANSVFNFNGGVLRVGQLLSSQSITVNGGALALTGSFANQAGSTFQLSSGTVIVPGSMANQGTFVQNGGLFDPVVFTNSGSFTLTGGTNVDGVFLNLAAATVLQSGGEHDVNVATNAGSWTLSGGTANLTNLILNGGGVFTNTGGRLVSTNAAGTGTLDVRNGTFALLSGTVTVNHLVVTNGASSVFTFNGGTLNSAGSTVNNGSIFRVGNGVDTATLDLLGGTHTFANDLLINTNATLTGTGAITGSITDDGLIAPGNGLGILTDTGSLTMLGGSAITMELGGTNSALYDQLALTGAFTFGGTLNVSLVNGYTVQAGDGFNLFDFGSSAGTFSTLNLPTLAGSLYWNTNALYTLGILEADALAGSLQVTLAPQAAIDAGALWRVDGGSWQGSGAVVTNLTVGSHTVSYTNLTGWIAPTNQTVQIAAGATTTNNGTYQLTPLLLAAVSRKTHGSAGTFDVNLSLGGTPTVEPRVTGPSQLVFTFNKPMAAADGTLDATEFVLTNATFVSASIVTSNLTLTLTNVVDQSRITVVMNGLADLSGNALSGTNAIIVRALFGDENQSGTVNVIDLQQTKNNLAATVTAANCLSDINCSGTINVIDLQQMKNSLTHTANGLVDSGGSGGSGGTSVMSLLVTGADTGSTTNTVAGTTTLGEALGAPDLTWSTNGDAVWAATTLADGSLAARSGSIGDLNVSWVETTVTGPVVLSFDWRVSSEAGGDSLTFSVDGVNQPGAISGEVSWQTMTFVIPSGQHRVTWTYGKNDRVTSGQDAGWVRRVVVE